MSNTASRPDDQPNQRRTARNVSLASSSPVSTIELDVGLVDHRAQHLVGVARLADRRRGERDHRLAPLVLRLHESAADERDERVDSLVGQGTVRREVLGEPQRLLGRRRRQRWRAPMGVDDEQVGGVRTDVQDGFSHGSRLTASAILCAACGLLADMTERIVTVDAAAGVELCIDEYGDSDDPTILLIAGAASSMDLWEPELCQQLADAGRHVIRYDHRDTGRSTTSPPGQPSYRSEDLFRDPVRLLDAIGRTRPIWSGCRWVEGSPRWSPSSDPSGCSRSP